MENENVGYLEKSLFLLKLFTPRLCDKILDLSQAIFDELRKSNERKKLSPRALRAVEHCLQTIGFLRAHYRGEAQTDEISRLRGAISEWQKELSHEKTIANRELCRISESIRTREKSIEKRQGLLQEYASRITQSENSDERKKIEAQTEYIDVERELLRELIKRKEQIERFTEEYFLLVQIFEEIERLSSEAVIENHPTNDAPSKA